MTSGSLSVLVVTGGHRVPMAEFASMFDAICAPRGWAWSHAQHPEAQGLLHPRNLGRWDAIVLHDIAGLQLRRGEAPQAVGPDAETRDALVTLLDGGQGLVVTHHSLASWPAWDGWAHALGGRFLYAPGTLDGTAWPSSGYRLDRHTLRVVGQGHPVCDGLDEFEVDDEVYLCPVFEGEVVPLLATDTARDGAAFRSTFEEVCDGSDVRCTAHPPASRLVAWAKAAGRSPLVYVQPGHGASTFEHPAYRRLLGNAIGWVASAPAHEWARAHPAAVDPS